MLLKYAHSIGLFDLYTLRILYEINKFKMNGNQNRTISTAFFLSPLIFIMLYLLI